jgi:hypothetical protein
LTFKKRVGYNYIQTTLRMICHVLTPVKPPVTYLWNTGSSREYQPI